MSEEIELGSKLDGRTIIFISWLSLCSLCICFSVSTSVHDVPLLWNNTWDNCMIVTSGYKNDFGSITVSVSYEMDR